MLLVFIEIALVVNNRQLRQNTVSILSTVKVSWSMDFYLKRLYIDWNKLYIMLTCPCTVDTLTLHFYIVKLGFTRVYTIFLFFSKTMIVGTRQNRLTETVLTCTYNLCFEQKSKRHIPFLTVNVIFQLNKLEYIT